MGLTAKDLARFSPDAQRQVMKQYAGQDLQREKNPKRGSKYNARPTALMMKGGSVHKFSSQKEADRYIDLVMLQRAGKIKDLRCQVPYLLVPMQTRPDGKKEQPVRYIADFVYQEDGREIVEDVKGCKDTASAAYKLFTVKRKLMLQVWGIMIKEV